MKLLHKIFIIVSLPFIIAVGIIFLFSRTAILKSFSNIERSQSQYNILRVQGFLENEAENISMLNEEYSAWDETYEFMVSRDDKYLTDYFNNTNDNFARSGIDLIILCDANDNMIFSKDAYEESDIKAFLEKYERKSLAAQVSKSIMLDRKKLTGIIQINDKPMLISAQPIVKSDNTGKPRGYLIFARYLDELEISRLSKQINLSFNIYGFDGLRKFNEQVNQPALKDVVIKVVDEKKIQGQGVLKDVFNKPAAIISINSQRIIYSEAKKKIYFFTVMLLFIGLLFNFTVISLLNKAVVRKITGIRKLIDNFNETGDLSQKVHIKGRDEISLLGRDFNLMFDKLHDFKRQTTKLAYYDPLTGLPNRKRLTERLEQKIAEGHDKFAVFFIDLDNFKNINDSLGHNVGDAILEKVAKRLKKLSQGKNLISRIGGDEFVIIQENFESISEVERLASDIGKMLRPVIRLYNREHYIGASIGISIYPEHGRDVSTLMKNADAAMYEAKKIGEHGYQFYSKTINGKTLDNLMMENDLRKALSKNEFRIYYQPIMSLSSNTVVGSEALIRWMHKEKLVPPGEFIPIAKYLGEIVNIDNWVMLNACIQCRKWQLSYKEELYISVNVSFKQLIQKNFTDHIKTCLIKSELEPECLNIEITEDDLMEDVEATIEVLQKLKAIGVRVSLDDFGTGYSSLSYVNMLPIDNIKIDRSLIMNIHSNDKNREIVRSIIAMAHSLNIKVIAEGIETEEQLKELQEFKCDSIQGFHISKPVETAKFEEMFL